MIEETFQDIAGGVALVLEAMVVLIIATAAVKAFAREVPLVFKNTLEVEIRYDVWMRFASSIIMALEFTVAADLIRTAISPSWDSIGKLGAIAVLRVGLGYFLGEDIEAAAEGKKRRHAARSAGE